MKGPSYTPGLSFVRERFECSPRTREFPEIHLHGARDGISLSSRHDKSHPFQRSFALIRNKMPCM
jgi:hypothetical protein